jgi:hypothetical protein
VRPPREGALAIPAAAPMGPLRRTERFLGARLIALEQQLPPDGTDSPNWREYVETAQAYARVRELIYGRRPGV